MSCAVGVAANAHLAAGDPIHYTEADTPEHTCLKEYPDQRGEVFVSAALPRYRSQADLLEVVIAALICGVPSYAVRCS